MIDGFLDLNITCNKGTDPIKWFWQIYDEDDFSHAHYYPVQGFEVSDICEIHIKHCFSRNGTYVLAIRLDNEFSNKEKIIRVFNKSRKSSQFSLILDRALTIFRSFLKSHVSHPPVLPKEALRLPCLGLDHRSRHRNYDNRSEHCLRSSTASSKSYIESSIQCSEP